MRTRLFIQNKLRKVPSALVEEEREVIFFILKDKFGFTVAQIKAFLPWSQSVIYKNIANAYWKDSALKKDHKFHKDCMAFIEYILYQSRYLP